MTNIVRARVYCRHCNALPGTKDCPVCKSSFPEMHVKTSYKTVHISERDMAMQEQPIVKRGRGRPKTK